jgi:hypothetical protein
MSGSADSLELVTPAPLDGAGLQRVRWRLERGPGGYALTYAGGGAAPVQVVAGPLHDAAFSYLDGRGQWQPEWKPDDVRPEVLPRMVRLRAGTAGGELVWIVPVLSDPWRPANLRPEESFGL